MSSTYARFKCNTCGETVYSVLQQEFSREIAERPVELTCSSGHTDQYSPREIEVVDAKPAGTLKARYAKAVGG